MGNYYPGMRVNVLDLSPNYAGTIIAITNGAGSFSGVIVPTFIGYMTPDVIIFEKQKRLEFLSEMKKKEWNLIGSIFTFFSQRLINGGLYFGPHFVLLLFEQQFI